MDDPLTPTVSVLVCTRDRPRELERCLAALGSLAPAADEIVVLDNGDDAEPARAIAHAHGADIIHEPRQGVSRARNAGAGHARYEIVAYIDDDAVPERNWVGELRTALADPSLSAVAGRVVSLSAPATADQHRRFDRTDPHWFEQVNFGGIGVGGNMAFRRDVLAGGQRFCEWLGVGTPIPGEDRYALFELIRDGHSIAYVPSAVVRHDDADKDAARRRRERRTAEASLAYAVALLVQEPGFRLATLRYLMGGLRGRRRERRPADKRGERPISRPALVARATLRYVKSRLGGRRHQGGMTIARPRLHR